jgi:hypothetical protein
MVYCILASCYIRYMSSTWLATPRRKNWHSRAAASGGEYSITDDGRVRQKHVLIESEK